MRWLASVAIAAIALGIALLPRTADAHLGSPDVFFEGDAGPYHVYVTVRVPVVIPGVADIEIRTTSPAVTAVTVVPLRLTGPGSELPPTPDAAARSDADPQFFTASLWLMEHGSLQVRIAVTGSDGAGELAVPIPAVAQRTLGMDRSLAAVLLGLMTLLSLAIVSILASAVRDAGLAPGDVATPRARRASAIMLAVAVVGVAGVLAFGSAWWQSEADTYEQMVAKPWKLEPRIDRCGLVLPEVFDPLLADHGHDLHLFLVRTPALDVLAHLHPVRDAATGAFIQALPPLPAGHYAVFADVVFPTGFPLTGTAEINLPDLGACPAPTGDDAMWLGEPARDMQFTPPPAFAVGRAESLKFRVVDGNGAPATDVQPYMGMAGHAMVVRSDLGVFAHLHPNGSVAMPALMLAGTPHAMYAGDRTLPADFSFPYGFPSAGSYRVFVQWKRAGRIETAAYDVVVPP